MFNQAFYKHLNKQIEFATIYKNHRRAGYILYFLLVPVQEKIR
jgi:hypothetical protein